MRQRAATGLSLTAYLVAVLCTSYADGVAAASVQVAVAANFRVAMENLAAAFAHKTGHVAPLTFGSTGKLYAQIRNGAPFELFLSADQKTPAQLEADGLALAGSRFTYAVGKLVLWSAREDYVDERGEVLRAGTFKHLAIANPRTAPYGAAAMQVLSNLGLLAAVQSKLVQGESVAQTHQFVFSGNAELGIIALSQVLRNGKMIGGSAWVIPSHFHDPLRQDGVILANAKDNPAAAALATYLKSKEAQAIIRAYGYDL